MKTEQVARLEARFASAEAEWLATWQDGDSLRPFHRALRIARAWERLGLPMTKEISPIFFIGFRPDFRAVSES